MNQSVAALSPQALAGRIVVIRGQRVLLDADLAQLYEVATKRFNEQIKRNPMRFPADFMFRLTEEEYESLRSQNVTSKRGGRRYLPLAFTEHGAIMAATVLNSPRAIEMSVYVVRAFVQLRGLAASHQELAQRLTELEQRIVHKLTTHDQAIAGIINTIRQLMTPPPAPAKHPMGFVHEETKKK